MKKWLAILEFSDWVTTPHMHLETAAIVRLEIEATSQRSAEKIIFMLYPIKGCLFDKMTYGIKEMNE